MAAIDELHEMGQSLWLDSISRRMLDSGTLAGYIRNHGISGLTSNPTIFDNAIASSHDYDGAIQAQRGKGMSSENRFFDIALMDLTRAADRFRPIFDASEGREGWVSIEVSPLLAHDTAQTMRAAVILHERARRPNLFIKIPGTSEGLKAVEESIFAGIPINITLLFSRAQCLAASTAYLRGIERRIAAGLDPKVASVASLFVSRWDAAVNPSLPPPLRNRVGIAVATQSYRAHLQVLASARWLRLANAGAIPQRLLWASTGTKDPTAPDTLYVDSLVARDTINTLPERTLLAFADHGRPRNALDSEDGDMDEVLAQCATAGIDINILAARLQKEGEAAFITSWNHLLVRIAGKADELGDADARAIPDQALQG